MSRRRRSRIYVIRHEGKGYIVERRFLFWWQQLRGAAYWARDDHYAPAACRFDSVRDAEEAIKVAIIIAGIERAHMRIAKIVPPWTPK